MSDEDNKLPKNPEKRHYQRIDLELPVDLEVNGEKVSATTENISCGGMFLPNISAEIKEKQEVITFIRLPDRSQSIRLPAKISRVEKKLKEAQKNIAVQFHGLYDDNLMAIDHYIKWKLLN